MKKRTVSISGKLKCFKIYLNCMNLPLEYWFRRSTTPLAAFIRPEIEINSTIQINVDLQELF